MYRFIVAVIIVIWIVYFALMLLKVPFSLIRTSAMRKVELDNYSDGFFKDLEKDIENIKEERECED